MGQAYPLVGGCQSISDQAWTVRSYFKIWREFAPLTTATFAQVNLCRVLNVRSFIIVANARAGPVAAASVRGESMGNWAARNSVRTRWEERHDLNNRTPNLTGSSNPDEDCG